MHDGHYTICFPTVNVVFVVTTLLILDDKVKIIFAFIISEVVPFSGLKLVSPAPTDRRVRTMVGPRNNMMRVAHGRCMGLSSCQK
jgi:hypothetical protein